MRFLYYNLLFLQIHLAKSYVNYGISFQSNLLRYCIIEQLEDFLCIFFFWYEVCLVKKLNPRL